LFTRPRAAGQRDSIRLFRRNRRARQI
jgi:hypothetical protein